ncbi:MAG: MoaD/ThiS family protein [Planctomycetes bacterium]|nr:MoaD/ThiS family protein [Planctomycetota bacterium]
MPTVFIPAQLQSFTGGARKVEVKGKTLREVIEALDAAFPGLRDRLVEGDRLRPGLAVAIDSVICSAGLRQAVRKDSEVHFIPAISGG